MIAVRETVRQFLRENLVLDGDEILSDDADLRETGVIDSFSIFTLVSFLESHFQIKLEARDMAQGGLSSVSAIDRLVTSRIEAQP